MPYLTDEDGNVITDESGNPLIAEGIPMYWVGDGSNTAWSTAANWASTSGGSDAVGPPIAGDTVVFDGSGTGNCVVDGDLTLHSLTMEEGYTGSFDLNDHDLTVDGGSLSLSPGVGSTVALGIGTITIGDADVTLAPAGTWSEETADWQFTGTTTFTGGSTRLATATVQATADITLSGSSYQMYVYGQLAHYGSIDTQTGGTVGIVYARGFRAYAGSSVTGQGSVRSVGNVIVDSGAIVSVAAYCYASGACSVSGVFGGWLYLNPAATSPVTVADGTQCAQLTITEPTTGTGELTFSGTFVCTGDVTYTLGAGDVTWTGGTLNLTGTANQTVAMNGHAHPEIVIDKTTSGNVSVTDANGSLGAVDMAGTFTATGTLTCTTDAKSFGGLFTAPATWTVSGAAWDFGGGLDVGACSSLTSTTASSYTFSGNGNIVGPSSGSLIFNGAMRLEAGVTVTVSAGGTFYFGAGNGEFAAVIAGTLSIASGRTFNSYKLSIESTGTISGAGSCYVYPSASGFGLLQQDGTISCNLFTIYGWVPAATVVGCTVASNTFAIRPSDNIAPDVEFIHTGLTAFQIFATTTGKTISGANGLKITTNASIAVNTLGSAITVDGVDIEMSGTGNPTVTSAATTTWGAVVINKASGTVTLSDAFAAANLRVESGTLNTNGKAVNCGTGDIDVVSPGLLSKTGLPGTAFTCGGFGVRGTDGANQMDIAAASAWTLTPSGDVRMRHANVAYCDAGAADVDAEGCTDGGNNSAGFDFTVPTRQAVGMLM